MGFKHFLNEIYSSKSDISSNDLEKGRTFFILDGVTARGVFVLTSGAFLAGFSKLMGADDSFNGIIGAVPTLGGLVQAFSPLIFERLKSRKLIITVLCLIHRILLSSLFFIPLFVRDTNLRLYILTVIIFLAYVSAGIMTPAVSNWIISLTEPRSRGNYFGKRDSILLLASTVISLSVGKMLDIYRNNNAEYNGFIAVAIISLITTIFNFAFLSSIPEPEVKLTKAMPKFKDILTKPLQDLNFRKVIIVYILWNIGFQIGGAFFSVYMVSGLDLNYSYITAMITFGTICAVFAARIYGKIADRTSWAFVTMLSIGILSLCHLTWAFVNKSNVYYLLPLAQLLSGMGWGGINIAIFNIQFKYSPEEGRTMYLGFNAAAGSFIGFAVAMLGAKLVKVLNGFTFVFAGLNFGNMQIVFGLSSILLIICSMSVLILFKEDARCKSIKQLVKELFGDTIFGSKNGRGIYK